MEIADQIVLINHGKIEQIGEPREIYEHPANEFVMSFVGPVNRLGDHYVRPHDVEIRQHPNGATREAIIERITHFGFEVRVELVLDDGRQLWSQITRDEAERLELENGEIVYIRPSRTRVFNGTGAPTSELTGGLGI